MKRRLCQLVGAPLAGPSAIGNASQHRLYATCCRSPSVCGTVVISKIGGARLYPLPTCRSQRACGGIQHWWRERVPFPAPRLHECRLALPCSGVATACSNTSLRLAVSAPSL